MKKQFNTQLRNLAGAGLLILFIASSFDSKGVNINITASTNWSAINTGSGPGGQPSATDDIVIATTANATLTVDFGNAITTATPVCNSITLGSTTANHTGTLTFTGTGHLTVSGTVMFGTAGKGGGILTMISTATLECAGFAAGKFNTYTSGGTTIFTGTNALPANFKTFSALEIKSGTTTLGANTTVTSLTVDNGATLSLGTTNFTLGIAGNLINNGTIGGTSTGKITLSTSGSTIDGTGSISNTGGITTAVAHTINSTADQSISGTETFAITAAVTITNNGIINSSNTGGITGISGTIWLQNASTAALTIAGPFFTTAGTVLTASAAGNTVIYTGATGYIVKATTYSNLTIAAAGTSTNMTATTVDGTLTLTSSILATNSTLTMGSGSAIARSAGSMTGTIQGSNSFTVTYTGNSMTAGPELTGGTGVRSTVTVNLTAGQALTLSAATAVTNLTVNTGSTLAGSTFTLGVSGNLAVNGTLSGTGIITLSGAAATIDGAGSISNTNSIDITAAHTINAAADLNIASAIAISSSITVTNNGTIVSTKTTGITGGNGTSTWVNGANSSLSVAGPLLATGTLTASAAGNTVIYIGATGYIVKPATYYNLTISATGTSTALSAATTVNHTLSLNSSTFAAGNYLTMGSGSSIADAGGLLTGTIQGGNAFDVAYTGNSLTISSVTFGSSLRNVTVTMNAGQTITLGVPLTLTAGLTLSSGIVILNGNNITAASISGGGSTSYIKCDNTATGATVTITSIGAGNTVFPLGTSDYTPVTVNNTGTAQGFSALVFDGVLQNGTTGGPQGNSSHAVNKTWIVTNLGSSPNVTLTTQWNAADENGSFSRTNSYISHYTAGAWDSHATSAASGSNPYTQSRSGITSFSPFAVGDNISPLPVQLISFNAKLQNKAVELSWATASEINNDYFTIERSADGIHFEDIMTKPGAGNSQAVINYTAFDEQPLPGISYYRLKQTDFNGASQTFNMVSVDNNVSMQDFNIASACPTLFSDHFTLNYKVPANGDVRVVVTNMSGAIVQDMTVPANMGDNNLNISNTMGWRSGIYIVQLYYNNWVNYIKVSKSL